VTRTALARASDVLALLICAGWGLYAAGMLEQLDYNFDEGVYIQQAGFVREGQRPYVDFFYHQTPLYPYTLAWVGAVAPDSLFAYRLPSLLATALCGLAVYAFARRLMPAPAALLAPVLFFYPPLQWFGLVALPNAIMLLLSTLGVLLVFAGRRRGTLALGSAVLVLAVLYKPLAIAAVIAVGAFLVAAPSQRRKVPVVALTGAAAGAAAWALLHLASDGGFTRMLLLQAGRYSGRGGFEIMSSFAPFQAVMAEHGIETAFQWNVHEHTRTYFTNGWRNANLHLLLLGLAGQLVLLASRDTGLRRAGWLLVAWWAAPFALSLFVWEPNWDHYYVQYIPPLAIGGAALLERAWRLETARLPVRIALAALVCVLVTGPLQLRQRVDEYWERSVPDTAGQTWLTFDPFLNFLTRTHPACGLVDPFNVYAEASLTANAEEESLARYHFGFDELIECLERDPEIKVGIGYWGSWFVDDRLRAWLDAQPCGRVIPVRRRYFF